MEELHPCENFQLLTAAAASQFDTCKCGHPRSAHNQETRGHPGNDSNGEAHLRIGAAMAAEHQINELAVASSTEEHKAKRPRLSTGRRLEDWDPSTFAPMGSNSTFTLNVTHM